VIIKDRVSKLILAILVLIPLFLFSSCSFFNNNSNDDNTDETEHKDIVVALSMNNYKDYLDIQSETESTGSLVIPTITTITLDGALECMDFSDATATFEDRDGTEVKELNISGHAVCSGAYLSLVDISGKVTMPYYNENDDSRIELTMDNYEYYLTIDSWSESTGMISIPTLYYKSFDGAKSNYLYLDVVITYGDENKTLKLNMGGYGLIGGNTGTNVKSISGHFIELK
jgi:hypothetical protein